LPPSRHGASLRYAFTVEGGSSEQRLLFLCTGNYYRSRFAEEYWNARAEQESLAWRAASRALADQLGSENPGTMSADALAELARLGIEARQALRSPLPMRGEEFVRYARVIALDGEEHRPMVLRSFPAHVERIEYWDIGDLWKEEPRSAMRRLVDRIAARPSPSAGGSCRRRRRPSRAPACGRWRPR
jgi:protein-tyrosine phosphatase